MTMDDVKTIMYNSSAFAAKGSSTNLVDPFLLMHEGEQYILFITEYSRLDGSNQHFGYSVYAVRDRAAVDVSSELYGEITKDLPERELLSNAGGKPDFSRRRKLSSLFEELASAFLDNGGLSEQELDSYQTYLRDMKELKSPSFGKVYAYFMNITGGNHGTV